MRVGTVKEIMRHEYRVGLTPDSVRAYVREGHEVYVEAGAGEGAGYSDSEYLAADAVIVPDAAAVFGLCDMVVKVKQPLPEEYPLLRPDRILFTYLHLAASRDLTDAMLAARVTGVGYETIEDHKGGLPCLLPMSQIAGRLSVQEGAKYLERPFGGRGVLLGGAPGAPRGKVAILGGGTVGINAARIALGLGADVTVLDVDPGRLSELEDRFDGRATTLLSTDEHISFVLREADLVIGAVLVRGAAAPRLVRHAHLPFMKAGAVIVDVAIDQGGCCETSRVTFHDDPVFLVEGIVHYCVSNIPGAVPRTSTQALNAATLRYGLKIAALGLDGACAADAGLARGVNMRAGELTHEAVRSWYESDT